MESAAFLEGLLSIPSPSGREDAVADSLVRQMGAMGFQAWRDEAGNALGVVGNPAAERTILLLGHMDTVAGDIPVHWERDRLYGRGAVDAKGPLAAFVLAAARVAPELSDARILVVGAVEEEAHSRGAHHLKESLPVPWCVLIGEPSGWQGITLSYKGALSVEYRLTLPNRHAAGQGATPAEEAVAFWNRLSAYVGEVNGGEGQRFDTLDASLRAIQTLNDGLQSQVEMAIDVRLPPGSDPQALQCQMRSWVNGARLSFPYQEPPYLGEKNTPPVRSLLRAIREAGGAPRFKVKTGTSDMNVVGAVWDCPMVAYGPGDSALDHSPDEHIEIGEFERGIEVLSRALALLARG